MIDRLPSVSLLISGALALSACTSAPSYQTLPGTGSSTSSLGGAALKAVASATPQLIAPLTGSINRATGAVALNDAGGVPFLDPNGFDTNGNLVSSGNVGSRLDSGGTGDFSNTYAYIIPIQYIYTVGGVPSTLTGTVGIETRGADIPTRGSAQYVGEAIGGYTPTGGLAQNLANGTTIVDVNFGAAQVDVTMGFVSTGAVDAIQGTGMQIVGTSFSGGSWAAYKNGALAPVTGLGSSTSSIGDFYGYDSSISGPDEVAGVVLISGPNGSVYGMYLAD